MNNDNNDGDDKKRDVKIVTSSSEEGKRWKRLGNWAGTFWEDKVWGTLAKLGAVYGFYNLIKDNFTKDLKDELSNKIDNKIDLVRKDIDLVRRDLIIVLLFNSFVTVLVGKVNAKQLNDKIDNKIDLVSSKIDNKTLIYFLLNVIVTLAASGGVVRAVKK
eukprot:CAMPEP_0197361542 /NCGR_PEP_ID=MMETSP0893-20130614/63438_1 /TAXON_ID=44058 ORGANISM="Aureoumbra lagunensis, Strain CCMP1510" /NCGR_SAMPLE_ID=MMETSP0893 /ASSEMBLY_ACC=CAM_ASM_000539 /LENGTH=159 /DNA_ID=CAMNT_0042883085 /DNA_START=907 /DNA_END=1387 /DNA_ORIENTATION=-